MLRRFTLLTFFVFCLSLSYGQTPPSFYSNATESFAGKQVTIKITVKDYTRVSSVQGNWKASSNIASIDNIALSETVSGANGYFGQINLAENDRTVNFAIITPNDLTLPDNHAFITITATLSSAASCVSPTVSASGTAYECTYEDDNAATQTVTPSTSYGEVCVLPMPTINWITPKNVCPKVNDLNISFTLAQNDQFSKLNFEIWVDGAKGTLESITNTNQTVSATIKNAFNIGANVAAQNFSLVIKEINSVTSSSAETVVQPTSITTSLTPTNITCNGARNGQITSSITGGTANYAYTWRTVNTSNQILSTLAASSSSVSSLSANIYRLLITDANNCLDSAQATIIDPAVLNISNLQATNVTCFGLNNGKLTPTVVGGTPNYTYKWEKLDANNNVLSTLTTTAAIATNLAPGKYRLVASDANDCETNSIGNIAQPQAALSSSISMLTQATCAKNNGTLSASYAGGNAGNFTYSWSNGPSTSENKLIPSGTYTVTVRDSKNCVSTSTAEMVSTDGEDPVFLSFPSNVTINANLNNGACAASHSWAAPETADDCGTVTSASTHVPGDTFALGESIVNYTITDAVGKTAEKSFTVTVINNYKPSFLIEQTTYTIALPERVCDYTFEVPSTITATGACGGNLTVTSSFSQQKLTPGTYTIDLLAEDQAQNVIDTTITVKVVPTMVFLHNKTVCSTNENFVLKANVKNGQFSAQFVTNNTLNAQAAYQNFKDNPALTPPYKLIVKYKYTGFSCVLTAADTLTIEECLAVNENLTANSFTLFPNPASESLQVKMPESLQGTTVYYTLTNVLGQVLQNNTIALTNNNTLQINTHTLTQGLYYLQLHTGTSKILALPFSIK
jgi:hypothetical protein